MCLVPKPRGTDTHVMARKQKKRKQSRKRRGSALRMPTTTLEKKIDFPWAPAAPKKAEPAEAPA